MKIRNELTGVVVSIDDTRAAQRLGRGWVEVDPPKSTSDDEPPKKKRGRPRKSEPSSE